MMKSNKQLSTLNVLFVRKHLKPERNFGIIKVISTLRMKDHRQKQKLRRSNVKFVILATRHMKHSRSTGKGSIPRKIYQQKLRSKMNLNLSKS